MNIDRLVAAQLKWNDEREKQKQQNLSVKNKKPQFRVEYRFPHGEKHWMYFLTIEDAKKFNYKKLTYTLLGFPIQEHPLSIQIQKRGKRGGWKKNEAT